MNIDRYTQFVFLDTIILLLTRSEVTGASLTLTSCPSFPASSLQNPTTKIEERTMDKRC